MIPHNENERRRIAAAMLGKSAPPVPTTRMFVLEDPSKLAPGDVVVEDGYPLRMMIKKLVVGFAECIWFDKQRRARTEIIHTSLLTLDADQHWRA
jgi:uncharacterized protein YodC (DUF2158 family)